MGTCPDCKQFVSDTTEACPNCGADFGLMMSIIRGATYIHPVLGGIVSLVFLVVLLYMAYFLITISWAIVDICASAGIIFLLSSALFLQKDIG